MRIKLIGAVSVLAFGLVVFWPGAAVGATAQPIPPRMACASLATPNAQLGAPGFPTLPGPPFLISAAADLTTDAGAVYCQVKGTISPQTHFELQMPENNWHGDYVQEGCGGFCGAANLNLQPASSLGCAPVANGEIALAIDDQGHTGVNGGDGTW
jgi:feruloyl esterase